MARKPSPSAKGTGSQHPTTIREKDLHFGTWCFLLQTWHLAEIPLSLLRKNCRKETTVSQHKKAWDMAAAGKNRHLKEFPAQIAGTGTTVASTRIGFVQVCHFNPKNNLFLQVNQELKEQSRWGRVQRINLSLQTTNTVTQCTTTALLVPQLLGQTQPAPRQYYRALPQFIPTHALMCMCTYTGNNPVRFWVFCF